MALFSRNKKAENESVVPETAKETSKQSVRTALMTDRDLSSVLLKPRVTEKAVGKSEQNVYTFLVRKDATKYDVRDAVTQLYKVTPLRVNIVNKRPRTEMSRSRGRKVSTPGHKKAYVYLKQGDTINLI